MKPGDIVEYGLEMGQGFVSMGFLEPLDMVELKKDRMIKHARHKAI